MKRTNNRMTIKFKEVNLKSNTFYTGIVKEVNFGKNNGSITNFVGFPIPLVALSAHIE